MTQILLVLSLVDFHAVPPSGSLSSRPHQDLPCPVGSVWLGSVQREDEEPAGSPSSLPDALAHLPRHPSLQVSNTGLHLSIFSGHTAMSLTTPSREDPCPGVKPRPGISILQLPSCGSMDRSRTISASPFSHLESGDNRRPATPLIRPILLEHILCTRCFSKSWGHHGEQDSVPALWS